MKTKTAADLEFEKNWNDYVDGMNRLKWNLHAKQQAELDPILGQLKKLVAVAATNKSEGK